MVIRIPAFDAGNYDRNGEHNPSDTSTFAGKTSSQDGRNPRRNWFAFHIPDYPGTLNSAALESYFASQTGTQRFELHEVSAPVDTLRRGGFGLTNILEDLADGPLYAAISVSSVYGAYLSVPLGGEGVAQIIASRTI